MRQRSGHYVPRIFNKNLTVIIVLILLYVSCTELSDTMYSQYKNVENEKIWNCFKKVLLKYPELNKYTISLEQKGINGSTMQAQPVITLRSLFSGVKKYKISLGKYVRDSKELKVSELPEPVLSGWFAHELGHIVDYEDYSNFGMLIYGLKYLFNEDFKTAVEQRADFIAIDNGFYKEIIATKVFIRDSEHVNDAYKSKMNRYYLSVDEVRMCVERKVPLKPNLSL